MNNRLLGFTIIELMVVITIIGMLAAVLAVNFNSARAESRDKVRQNTLQEMQIAIELYKTQYGVYPVPGCGVGYDSGSPQWVGSETYPNYPSVKSCPDNYIVGLAPNFISELPSEVGPGPADKGYVYASNGDAYKLMSHYNVEVALVESHDDNFSRYMTTCSGAKGNSIPEGEKYVYAVYSAGAECW
jgi:prepilin-type N-terminal cleavage/methylation domain-containing protein